MTSGAGVSVFGGLWAFLVFAGVGAPVLLFPSLLCIRFSIFHLKCQAFFSKLLLFFLKRYDKITHMKMNRIIKKTLFERDMTAGELCAKMGMTENSPHKPLVLAMG